MHLIVHFAQPLSEISIDSMERSGMLSNSITNTNSLSRFHRSMSMGQGWPNQSITSKYMQGNNDSGSGQNSKVILRRRNNSTCDGISCAPSHIQLTYLFSNFHLQTVAPYCCVIHRKICESSYQTRYSRFRLTFLHRIKPNRTWHCLRMKMNRSFRLPKTLTQKPKTLRLHATKMLPRPRPTLTVSPANRTGIPIVCRTRPTISTKIFVCYLDRQWCSLWSNIIWKSFAIR